MFLLIERLKRGTDIWPRLVLSDGGIFTSIGLLISRTAHSGDVKIVTLYEKQSHPVKVFVWCVLRAGVVTGPLFCKGVL